MDDDKKILVVGGAIGCKSDGLIDLLNAHSQICVAKDRYPLQYALQGNFTPALFSAERLADLRFTDSYRANDPEWREELKDLVDLWENARVVGDRCDGQVEDLGRFLRAQPEARCILLLRNLKDVALAWENASVTASSGEDLSTGFENGCDHWASQVSQIQTLLASKDISDRILLIDLDHSFEHDSPVVRALLGFLELEHEAGFDLAWKAEAEHAKQQANASGKVPKEHVGTYKRVMTDSFRRLRKLAAQKAAQFASEPV